MNRRNAFTLILTLVLLLLVLPGPTGAQEGINKPHREEQWATIESENYDRLLHDNGTQALLHTTAARAEKLPTPRPRAFGAIPSDIEYDPLIAGMIAQVTSTTVYSYDGSLSGEWPVKIGGSPYTIVTRHTYSGEPIQKATQYVYEHFEHLGLDVVYHQWGGSTYPNVIATKVGLTNPDDIYILCAHLDDMPEGPMAPGADDNGSGSTAVMIAADILTQYNFGCTLKFALWTGEEQGLLGSDAYAEDAATAGDDILGVLNLDMIGWDNLYGPIIELHATSTLTPTLELAQLFSDTVSTYNINLNSQIVPDGTGASDHASFWDEGYTAILAIEDTWSGATEDFNDYYHTVNDRLQYLNLSYFTEFVKATVGAFAHMSCLIPGGVGFLDGTVIGEGGGPLRDVSITMHNQTSGPLVETNTDVSGYYTRTVVAGTYTITATKYGYLPGVATDVVVLTDTLTTRNFTLTVASPYVISGTVTEGGTANPLTATVLFQGSPISVTTNPATGYYSATVAEGSYTMRVTSLGYRSQTRKVVVDQHQTQNFALEILPCVLLVDDDKNNPDVQSYYTAPLDNLHVKYDIWDLTTQGNPAADDLMGYQIVLWFTGYPYDNTFNSTNEAAVASYLDAGGNFFLSSHEYLYEMWPTSFAQDYLQIGSRTNDVMWTDPVGNSGNPIGNGLGPYTLSAPPGFEYMWTDDADDTGNPGVSSPFRWAGTGHNNSTNYDSATFKTVFLAWPFEALANLGDRTTVMGRIIEWFGGCACEPVTGVDFTTNGPMELGGPMHFTATLTPLVATAPITYEWDFGGAGEGHGTGTATPVFTYTDFGLHTVTLTATNCVNRTAWSTAPVEVLAPSRLYLPIIVKSPN